MRALHHSVVLKRKLSRKAKLSMFKSIFVTILIYGHQSWVMTERARSQMQASEMRFLRKSKGVMMFDKHRNTAICESFHIESLLLQIERSQLRWFGNVSRMPYERLPKQTLNAKSEWEEASWKTMNKMARLFRGSWFEPFGTLFKRNAVCVCGSRNVAA